MGNYWDTYQGNDIDTDRIGDEPYYVPSIGIDHYPLMQPVTVDSKAIRIDIIDPSTNVVMKGEYIVKGSIYSEKEISQVKLRIDSYDWMLAEGKNDWQKTIDTNSYDNGDHTLMVFARTSDNQSILYQTQITIDNEQISNNITSDESPGFYFSMIVIILFCFLILKKRKM